MSVVALLVALAAGVIKGETEYRDPSNPDEPLPPEHMIKAFRCDMVPGAWPC